MSGLLTGKAFTTQFPEIDTTDTGRGSASLQGTVVAIYEIGCFFGSLLAMVFGEKLGRRRIIMAGCLILAIGGALQASASSIPHMIVGRIVAGLGNGLNTSTIRESMPKKNPSIMIDGKSSLTLNDYAAVWHSELMQADKRGKGVSLDTPHHPERPVPSSSYRYSGCG